MKIYAVYRGHYGHDFVRQSIESIEPYVDNIFFFWTPMSWGQEDFWDCEPDSLPAKLFMEVIGCTSRAPERSPYRMKNGVELLGQTEKLLKSLFLIRHDTLVPHNSMTTMMNDYLLAHFVRPDRIMCIEPDMVWGKDELERFIEDSRASSKPVVQSMQREIWRPPQADRYYVVWPPRDYRNGVTMWNTEKLFFIPPTGTQGEPISGPCPRSCARVHNMGFAVSRETMEYKQRLALSFSEKIGDSLPRPDWVENVWLKWAPGDQNLEISIGHESSIKEAVEYDHDGLPETIKS